MVIKYIGISGKKGSGKSTLARFMREEYVATTNKLCYIVNFADALKKEVSIACVCSPDYIEKNKTIFRPMLQWWGTDYRRGLWGQSYWITQWLNHINVLPHSTGLVIAADVRFENEAALIRAKGGLLIRMERNNDGDTHSSETNLDHYQFDNTVTNNATLGALKVIAQNLIRQVI